MNNKKHNMNKNKYDESDRKLEALRYNFFKGLQGDGNTICGTCQHFETILDDSGSITSLGRCYQNCPVKNGLDKVHAESNVSRYTNHNIETKYKEYSNDI